MADYNAILKKYWGYDHFFPLQEEVIRSVGQGVDTLALMPTGGGKTITYQVPALASEGICIVVTPLISLMKDQIDQLRRRRIPALCVHSGMMSKEIDIALDNCVYGDYKFLYVSAERLHTKIFLSRLARMKVCLLAVDEAHCISQWGYDFRPSYLRIAEIRQIIPDAPVLAVTATATPEVAEDIMLQLRFGKPNVKRMSFARENLSYLVRHTEDKNDHLLRIINSVDGSGIVYVRTRKHAEEISAFLNEHRIDADFYHGGMQHGFRTAKQEAWTGNKRRVIVATNAFGMGIDKADVRYVVHYELPDSLEAYYQEAGRAGRDKKPAFAVLLHTPSDNAALLKRARSEFPSMEQIKQLYESLFNYLQIPIGAGKESVIDFNLYDFCYKFNVFTLTALNSIKILQLNGYVTLTEEIDNPTRVMFSVSREELYRIQVERSDLEKFIRIILRLYTGIFSEFVQIDEEYIAHVSGYTKEYIADAFWKLGQLRVIRYIPRKRTPLLILNEERLPGENLFISSDSYERRKKSTFKRIEAVMEYVNATDQCRSGMLQRYFGEPTAKKCGKCDVCRDEKAVDKGSPENIRDRIAAILETEACDVKKLVSLIRQDAAMIVETIRRMTEENLIEQRSDGILRLKNRAKQQ